jgi:serine/threonine protein kinase
LSHYTVIEELGRGGIGIVYRARDETLQREVALKLLSPDLVSDPEWKAQFVREARAVASLDHPHIAAVHEFEEADGESFIVVELIAGQTLRAMLESGGVALSRALQLATEVAEALACAHEKGIVHRDLKPSNVMVTAQGHAKVIDFGLVRLVQPSARRPGDTTTSTESSRVVGTVSYMSPEQARGQRVDHRSDLFSFGVMLYELLAGLRPFDRDNLADTLLAIVRDDRPPLPPIAGVSGEVTKGLQAVLDKCLEPDPAERYQRSTDLVADLRGAQRTLESGVHRASWWPTVRPARASAIGATSIIVALLLVGALVYHGWMAPRPHSTPAGVRQQATPLAGWTPRQLTNAPGWERSPVLSPDGSMIAYVSDESGNPDIWVVDTDGGDPIQLTDDPAADERPAWFPDGRSLAFESNRGGGTAIWRVPRLGGSAAMIVPNASHPDVSPDGRQIAFARAAGGPMLRIAIALLSDTSRARVLTSDAMDCGTASTWT